MNRRSFLEMSALGALAGATQGMAAPGSPYQVGAYYFPNFHVDPANEEIHGRGWTEWELLKRGEPKFAGHVQPKVPLWGREDESDPSVFAKKIDAAADHGLNYFIFDWYWYRGAPFLHRALEKGFFGAPNNRRLKFCLMWANHDWMNLFPARLHMPYELLYHGPVDGEQFEAVTDYVVKTYFSHPSYWTVGGRPYFSVYELFGLVKGLGGVEATAAALQRFRQKTKAAGFPDLHFNAVAWGVKVLPEMAGVASPSQLLSRLGVDSVCSYTWIHHATLQGFPSASYASVAEQGERYWDTASREFPVPYFPNVSMGWDSTPRTCQSDIFTLSDYPFLPVVTGNTPEVFQQQLARVKDFLDTHPASANTFNINAWNEWTEGSYLEPDSQNGFEFLKAIQSVFGRPA
jgi:hypothetical protein